MTVVRSFEKHLSRWHGSMLNQTFVSFDDSTVENHADIGTGTINVQDFSGLIECVDKTTQKKDTFVKNLLYFCLKLKEKYVRLSATYNDIMDNLVTPFAAFHRDVIQKVPISFNTNDDDWYLSDENFCLTCKIS